MRQTRQANRKLGVVMKMGKGRGRKKIYFLLRYVFLESCRRGALKLLTN